MRDVTPPLRSQRAFNESRSAARTRERSTKSEQAYNHEVPRERGEVKAPLQSEGYDYLNKTARGSLTFYPLLAEYRQASEVTRQRLYLETMRDVLPTVKQLFIFDTEQQLPFLPFLDLQRGPSGVAPAETKEK